MLFAIYLVYLRLLHKQKGPLLIQGIVIRRGSVQPQPEKRRPAMDMLSIILSTLRLSARDPSTTCRLRVDGRVDRSARR